MWRENQCTISQHITAIGLLVFRLYLFAIYTRIEDPSRITSLEYPAFCGAATSFPTQVETFPHNIPKSNTWLPGLLVERIYESLQR